MHNTTNCMPCALPYCCTAGCYTDCWLGCGVEAGTTFETMAFVQGMIDAGVTTTSAQAKERHSTAWHDARHSRAQQGTALHSTAYRAVCFQ